jgi:hypothetical protein
VITRLVRVELLRLWSRRLVKIGLVVMLGGMLFANIGELLSKDSDPNASRERADKQAALMLQDCERFRDVDFPREVEAGNIPSDAQPPVCNADDPQFRAENFLFDERYILSESGRNDIIGAGFAWAAVAFLIGTSFAGAEWAAGTMAALLFWEPRRVRVLIGKIVALGLFTAVTAMAVSVVQLGLALMKGSLRGSTAVPDGFWGDRLADGGRMAAIAVFAALLAFGIAGIARVTAAALGIAFAYFAIVENVIRGLRPGWRRFLIGEQFQAWVEGRAELPLTNSFDGFGEGAKVFVLERARAGSTLAIYLTIVLGVMIALFARRDVT